ncbi:TetR family transcriptional regulator C-terminal domain-containing protein [Streptomyces sp. NPDC054838]
MPSGLQPPFGLGGLKPAGLGLARVLRSMLPTDAELRQDWKCGRSCGCAAQHDTAARHLAVDLYDRLHAWVAGAIEQGTGAEEFTDCDVTALSTLVPALCDGPGIRPMPDDPRVDLATARSTIWRTIAPTPGIAPTPQEI